LGFTRNNFVLQGGGGVLTGLRNGKSEPQNQGPAVFNGAEKKHRLSNQARVGWWGWVSEKSSDAWDKVTKIQGGKKKTNQTHTAFSKPAKINCGVQRICLVDT